MFHNTEYDVLTPAGFKPFVGLQEVNKTGKINIYLKSGKTLTCALNHRVQTSDGWKFAIDLRDKDLIITVDGEEEIFFIDIDERDHDFYDLVGVEGLEYYTNGILSHNCEFLGSANTLIDGRVLQRLTYIPPISSQNRVDVYKQPQQKHKYVIVVDTSRGVDIDYSAFVVFDVTQIPYNVVCKFKDNEISPLIYPNIIFQVAQHYNNAYVLVETNDIGQQVADILHADLEYDGVLVTQSKGRAGQKLGGGFGKIRSQFGVRTTKQVKRIGCANFKSLVENNKLIINDYDLLFEMARFIENKASYEAEEGFHDDLVMCCVLFGWLSNQVYFKDITDTDARNALLAETRSLLDDEFTPFGFIDDGVESSDSYFFEALEDDFFRS